MERDSLTQILNKFDRTIHHYEIIAWQVTALFVAATAILISIPIVPPPSFFLYFLGLAIAISAILFNISLRRRQHFYICAKKEVLAKIQKRAKENKKDLGDYEKLELIINDSFKEGRFNQWICYLILFSFIISYWFYKLFWWINNSHLRLNLRLIDKMDFTTKIILFFFCLLISALLCVIFNNLGYFKTSQFFLKKIEGDIMSPKPTNFQSGLVENL